MEKENGKFHAHISLTNVKCKQLRSAYTLLSCTFCLNLKVSPFFFSVPLPSSLHPSLSHNLHLFHLYPVQHPSSTPLSFSHSFLPAPLFSSISLHPGLSFLPSSLRSASPPSILAVPMTAVLSWHLSAAPQLVCVWSAPLQLSSTLYLLVLVLPFFTDRRSAASLPTHCRC